MEQFLNRCKLDALDPVLCKTQSLLFIFLLTTAFAMPQLDYASLVPFKKQDDAKPDNSSQLVSQCSNTPLGYEILSNVMIQNIVCKATLNICGSQKREDYIHAPGVGTYKMHTSVVTFNEARKICNEEGAHLAVINSLVEETILLDIYKKKKHEIHNGGSVAFIGVHDLFSEGDWVTILGDSIYKAGYAKWTTKWPNQPDNRDGNQHCGTLEMDGGMDDVGCQDKHAFFCELP